MKSMEDKIEIMNKINDIHLGQSLDRDKFIDFITNCESDMYSGKNEDNEGIVISIQKDIGIKVSTYQSNGWIRVNNYTLSKEDGYTDIIMEETFEK